MLTTIMDQESIDDKVENVHKSSKLKNVISHLVAKGKEWSKRYGPAEVIGTATAYAGFLFIQDQTNSEIAAAYAGAMGENLGFYGTMITKDVIRDVREARNEGRHYGFRDGMRTAGRLLAEFGPAEALDSLLTRPATMSFASRTFGEESGILVGKLAADLIFYIPTIVFYESMRRRNRTSSDS